MLPELNYGRLQKHISLASTVNVLLIMLIAGLVIFGWSYLHRINPAESIRSWLVQAGVPPTPRLLFAVYGSGGRALNKPRATVVYRDKIFVADTMNARVAVFDYNGKFIASIGQRAGQQGLRQPVSVAVSGGKLYVADAGLGKIASYNLAGEFTGFFAADKIKMPTWITVRDNRFYVFDAYYHAVTVFNAAGKVLAQFGHMGSGAGEFNFPRGIAVDRYGTIYVADSNNNRLQIFNYQGKLKKILTGYSYPRGVALTGRHIFTAEPLDGTVAVGDDDGEIGTRFNEAVHEAAHEAKKDVMKYPTSVFIDAHNRLYVTEFGKSRVLVYSLEP